MVVVEGSSLKRYVQQGRVVLLTSGEYSGKLAAIVDIVDHKRVSSSGSQS